MKGEVNKPLVFNEPEPLVKLLSMCFFVFILAFMVNGSIPQLQMFLFNDHVPIPMTAIKLIAVLLCCGIAFLLLRRRVELYSSLMFSWLLFTAYVAAEIALQISNTLILVTSVLSVYFFVFVIPLVLYLRGSLQEKHIVRVLLTIFYFLAILGIAQFSLKDPLLPTSSNNESFIVYSWTFHEKVRAFSLFESGYSFGHYIAIAGAIVLLIPMNRLVKLLVMSLIIFCGYATLTRNTYLEIMIVLISAIAIAKNNNSRSTPYLLSLASAFVGYFIMKFAPFISSKLGGEDIADIATHASRVSEWSAIMNKWLATDDFTALFGTGSSQGFGFQYVDNMYLAIGAQFGIFGLFFFGVLFLAMTKYVFKEARERKSPLSIGVAAFWTSFPLVSFFNISLPPYIFLFIILMLTRKGSEVNDQ